MNFTFKEWQSILHDLTVAKSQYINHMNDSKPSDEPYSMYQIFKRQSERTQEFIDRIESTVL